MSYNLENCTNSLIGYLRTDLLSHFYDTTRAIRLLIGLTRPRLPVLGNNCPSISLCLCS